MGRPSNQITKHLALLAASLGAYQSLWSQQAPATSDEPNIATGSEPTKPGDGTWESVPRFKQKKISNFSIEDIVEPSADYHYSGFGRSNPFQFPTQLFADGSGRSNSPVASQKTAKDINGVEIPIVNPLQNYPLESLVVSGIVMGSESERKALIMTPNREGVVVKKNDPIAHGKILDITAQRVTVRQYSLRKDGAREYSDHELYLGSYTNPEAGYISLKPGGEVAIKRPQTGQLVPEGLVGQAAKTSQFNPETAPKTPFLTPPQNAVSPVTIPTTQGSPIPPSSSP